MKIATWNLERLIKNKNALVIEKLTDVNADILILTETSSKIRLKNYHCVSTESLPVDFDNIKYKTCENRVSIWAKYKVLRQHVTFDKYTSVCADIESPFGTITVYGSIIGVFGNQQPRFDNDLNGQISDFERIFPDKNICFAGDLNVTFSGRIWPSKKVRQTLLDVFDSFKLINITANISDTVDHIILSDQFLENTKVEIETWNQDRKLSDHVGHAVTLSY